MLGNLPSLNGLRAFAAAARHLSFTRAAEELHVTRGAVSYQVRRLEEQLGIRLFQRKTRQILLTNEGQQLFVTVQRAFGSISEEVAAISPHRSSHVLTVALSTYVATRWLSRRLNGFLERYSEIALRLQHSVNSADFTMEDVDLAIRWGRGEWANTRSQLLFPSYLMPVCSRRLVQGPKPLVNPGDLRDHTLIHAEEGYDLWAEWLTKAGVDHLEANDTSRIVDPNVRIQAAIDSQGVALGDDLVADEIAAGRLVAPFEAKLDAYGYYVVQGSRASESDQVAAFRDWLLAEASPTSAIRHGCQ